MSTKDPQAGTRSDRGAIDPAADLQDTRARRDGVTGDRALRAERLMEKPLMIAAALTLPCVALTETEVGGPLELAAQILNWGTWLVFAAELVIMLALVPDRWRYLRHHPLEVVVVLLTPPALPAALQSLRVIRLFRLLRLLRLLKFAQVSHRVFSNEGLGYAAFMTLLIAVAGGLVFRAFEGGHQTLSEWEALYWAVSSMTTLGSQWEPTTVGSQITGIVVQLVGISFMAMLTGAIARNFFSYHRAQEDERRRG